MSVATEIKCGASRDACDRLAASYRELDKQMQDAAQKQLQKK